MKVTEVAGMTVLGSTGRHFKLRPWTWQFEGPVRAQIFRLVDAHLGTSWKIVVVGGAFLFTWGQHLEGGDCLLLPR
jgi:hypothetical protein